MIMKIIKRRKKKQTENHYEKFHPNKPFIGTRISNRKLCKKIKQLINFSINLALNSTNGKARHSAIILRNRQIIGYGYNTYNKTGNNYQLNGNKLNGSYTIHAEINAMWNAITANNIRNFNNCVIIIIRIPISLQENNIEINDCLDSFPCNKCLKALLKKGFNYSSIFYS